MIPAPWPGPRERAGGLARDGFRVLAVAAADRPAVPDVNELEQGLRLLGRIGITDPPAGPPPPPSHPAGPPESPPC